MDDEEVRASSPLAPLALTSRGVLFLLPGDSERRFTPQWLACASNNIILNIAFKDKELFALFAVYPEKMDPGTM